MHIFIYEDFRHAFRYFYGDTSYYYYLINWDLQTCLGFIHTIQKKIS